MTHTINSLSIHRLPLTQEAHRMPVIKGGCVSTKITPVDSTDILNLSRREKIKNIAIKSAKISVVALSIIVLLGAAVASMYFAFPLFAAGGWSIIGGLALSSAAAFLVGGAVLSTISSVSDKDKMMPELMRDLHFKGNKDWINTPMFKVTEHNARDCLVYLGKVLGTGAVFGAMGAVIIPFIGATVFRVGILIRVN